MDRAITLPDGTKYLETKFRIADFRKAYPLGRIETEIIRSGPAWAVFKASVYGDLKGSRLLAEAHAYRKYTEVNPSYLEMAETAAIGRALSDLGFDLPYKEMEGNAGDMGRFAEEMDDGTLYLAAKYRVAAFRKENPKGLVRKDIIEFDERHCIMKARVFNADGDLLSAAHARRDWKKDMDAGEYFLESAETAAEGRAMSILGYDLPPGTSTSSDIQEGCPQALYVPDNTGIVRPPEDIDTAPEAAWDYVPQEFANDAIPAWQAAAYQQQETHGPAPDQWYMEDTHALAGTDMPAWQPAASQGTPVPEPAWVMDAEEIPFDPDPQQCEGQMEMDFMAGNKAAPLEEARNKVVPFGPNQGRTLGQVADSGAEGIHFLTQLVEVYTGDPELVDAARKILDAS
ncbi:MAG: hypothetical protein LUE14_12430 [Clostridiales bacterium]|nr:hypothetical protein [Clostridiales bacterium]